MTDIFAKAMLLPDNELIVVKYEITKHIIGKIQLSNYVRLLDKKMQEKLKTVLRFIEKYSTDYYYIPCQDTKGNG